MTDVIDVCAFRSAKFAPVLPEESQVNPQAYGAELAYWLCVALAKRGLVTSYPENEDWGWYLEFLPDSGSEFALHCVNVEGARDRWQLSLRRHGRKMFGRDKPAYSEASPLMRAIKSLLEEEPEVAELDWRLGPIDN